MNTSKFEGGQIFTHCLFAFNVARNICSHSTNNSNIAKIVQFNKGMGKIWGVWCKGV
jgi:hypothetical protein